MKDPVDCRRRRLLLGLAALPVTGLAAGRGTPSASEGPFYPTAGMRFDDIDNDLVRVADRVQQSGGEVMMLSGRVLNTDGRPIEGARVEIWQCDSNGRYLHTGDRGGKARDAGFQGFGHDLSRADGEYRFRTIKPVPYPGRTPHIHVKVLIDDRSRLTTQFYLDDHPQNQRDWLYRRIPRDQLERVTLKLQSDAETPQARLDIILS